MDQMGFNSLISLVVLWLIGSVGGPVKDGLDIVNELNGIPQKVAVEGPVTLRLPALSDELRIESFRSICEMVPSDHVTYEIQVRNEGEQATLLDKVEVNIDKHSFNGTKRERTKATCGINRGHNQAVVVTIDCKSLEYGKPYSERLNVSVPPGGARTFYLTVKLAQIPLGYEDRFNASGVVVLHSRSRNVSLPFRLYSCPIIRSAFG